MPELRIILVIYKLVTFTTVAYIINREMVSFINNSSRILRWLLMIAIAARKMLLTNLS